MSPKQKQMLIRKVVIVGAGPAGLYASMCWLSKDPSCQIILCESTNSIGGRTRMTCFDHRMMVPMGAGVVRSRDRMLRQLCRRLAIPLRPFTTAISYNKLDKSMHAGADHALLRLVCQMEERRDEWDRSRTFSENMRSLLGDEAYKQFVAYAGATDYENADVVDTVEDFGFQDNTSGQRMFGVRWNALAEAMLRTLQADFQDRFVLHRGHRVTAVSYDADRRVSIRTTAGSFQADYLVWTAPRPSWGILTHAVRSSTIPSRHHEWRSLLRQVRGQPFLRMYARASLEALRPAAEAFPSTTYLPSSNVLQKIIPMSAEEGIYMISYSDNEHAMVTRGLPLHHIADGRLTYGITWRRDTIRRYYHACGTHYYRPLGLQRTWRTRQDMLRYASRPTEWLFMASEGLSQNQGWTEGALESVRAMMHRVEEVIFVEEMR